MSREAGLPGAGEDLAARGLSKDFGATRVLSDLSFSVVAGERLAIQGRSGSGKTTLLRLLAGLELPDAGEVRLGGALASRPGWGLPPHRRGIGLAFQFPALWPHMTVAANIDFGLAGLPRAERRERVAAWLARMDLAELGGRYPDQLSGGQAKRVALARALAPAPARLLLDEPLTHVEPDLRDRLVAVILDQAAVTGATLLYVTHDPAEAAAVGGRVLRLGDRSAVEPA